MIPQLSSKPCTQNPCKAPSTVVVQQPMAPLATVELVTHGALEGLQLVFRVHE